MDSTVAYYRLLVGIHIESFFLSVGPVYRKSELSLGNRAPLVHLPTPPTNT